MTFDLEKIFLGYCLYGEDNVRFAISSNVEPEFFQNPNCRKIWSHIKSNYEQGRPTDIIAVGMYFHEAKDNDAVIVATECEAQCSGSLNFQYFVRQLLERYHRGAALLRLNEITRTASNASLDDIREDIKAVIDRDLQLSAVSGVMETYEASIEKTIDVLSERAEQFQNGKPNGIDTGFVRLNETIGGFLPGKYYVLAGRTGMGKTALALNFAVSAAYQNKRTAYFSVEMTAQHIIERILASEGAIPIQKITSGKLNESELDRLVEATKRVYKFKGFIGHRFKRSCEEIEKEVHRLYERKECDFVVVDYIQQLKVNQKTGSNFQMRHAELTEISSRLQALATSLQIPILVLAQVNREAANKTGKKDKQDYVPQIHQIKDSGSMEQDADVVMFVHRENYYDESWDQNWIVISKNRNGPPGRIEIGANMECCKFFDIAENTKTFTKGDWD